MTEILKSLEKNYILFEKTKINIIIDENDMIWFLAKDVANTLGYTNTHDPIQNLINKSDKTLYKNIIHNFDIKMQPNTIYLNESGLYSLVLKSKKPMARKFSDWVTGTVLPSIRKYGYYKMKIEYENKSTNLLKQIDYYKKQNELMKNDLKKNKYPDGAVFYVLDYSDEDENVDGIFRIGKAGNMNTRKKIYDTHMLHNKNAIVRESTNEPERLEYCVRSMLYKYRYKNRKDFYICKKSIIKKADNYDVKIKRLNKKLDL